MVLTTKLNRQHVSKNTDWEPMMITLPDGNRVSYAGLGSYL